MISNVCKIENGTSDLAAILKESERVAEYNDLDAKQTLQLRLLCEETDGMLPNLIDDFSGDLWFEFEQGICKICVSIQIPDFNIDKKDDLIAISRSKKNAAARGIVGEIRNAIENFFLNEEVMEAVQTSSDAVVFANGYSRGVDYAYLWSLDQRRKTQKPDEKDEEWDELEKSVIASIADDVIVGIKGKQADITIVKKFA